ncbi:MAG: hypothetical protein ACKVOR_00035, partial [Flavobacteriales bacterium]
LAMCITYFVFNLLRFIFIWYKMKMQPYNLSFITVFAIGWIALTSAWFIKSEVSPVALIAMKAAVFSVVFVLLLYYSRVAVDINGIADNAISRLRRQ